MQRAVNWVRVDSEQDNGINKIEYIYRNTTSLIIKIDATDGHIFAIDYYTCSDVILNTGSLLNGCTTFPMRSRIKPTIGYIHLLEPKSPSLIKFVLDMINQESPMDECKVEVNSLLKIDNFLGINIVSKMAQEIQSLQQSDQQAFKPSLFK